MDITVYIPTKGRQEKLLTLKALLKYSNIRPILVHPDSESHDYNKIQIVNMKYLGQVWQHILEQCPTNGVIIIDDDLKFNVRYKGWSDTLIPVRDLNPMFDWMVEQLDKGYVHGAISLRRGNNFTNEDFKDCTNAKDCLFFNKRILLDENARLDRLKTMQDFDITLQLLSLGYPNRVGYNWSCDQKNPVAPGGTALYRTPEVQEEAANQLADMWPGIVKVVKKKAASKKAIYGNTRTDVRIQWRKCWKNRNQEHKTFIQVPEPIL